ncbi:ATP-dependent transcriptional regulator, MalT- like, LuxR family [Conexibacter woesei DSM 14684]|uniref:ATP-dependent transcriptional regulator, MalT-like, LuxR family n=2 Tax=Conexibacter TaxID=191494 RepID=D3F496_CONWI|nr:ATP-dependent transcriptional regulator, MalT- like, LuxR family [Conexibacter woesei DSM 14684]
MIRGVGVPADTLEASPLERENEFAALEARVRAAVERGVGSVLVVTGPAGAGKTTLLGALASSAAPRLRVLNATGADVECDLPFGVVRQLVERPVLALPAAAQAELLAGPASAVRALLNGPVDAPVDSAAAIAHGLYWLLARLTDQQPVCVLVDDAHWCDAESMDALTYVARRADGHPLVLVVATRDDEPDAHAWSRLHAIESTAVLRPAPLSAEASARLVSSFMAAPASAPFASACHRLTAGNPRLLVELLATCRDMAIAPDAAGAAAIATIAPERLGTMVLERIARLGDHALALSRAVAVLEHGRMSDTAAVALLDAVDAEHAARRLVDGALLLDELPLRFVHPLTGAIVLGQLGSAERDGAHRRAAAVLASHDRDAAALHLLRCEPAGESWAAETLRDAAHAALRRGTPAAAVRLLDRALAEGGQGTAIRAELAGALLAAGDPRAVEELHWAVRACRDDPSRRAALVAQLALAQFTTGDVAACTRTLRAALDDLAPLDDGGGVGGIEIVATAALLPQGDQTLRAAAVLRARSMTGDPRLGAIAAIDRVCRGEPASETTPGAAARLRELVGSAGGDVAPAFHVLVWALACYDEVDVASDALEHAFDVAREHGSRLRYGMACYLRAWTRWCRGDLLGVLADVDETLAFAAEGGAIAVPNMLWEQAECRLARGNVAGCAAALDAGFAAVDSTRWELAGAWLRHGRAGQLLRAGEPVGALREALAAGELFSSMDMPSPAVVDWRGRAVRAAVAVGELDRARAIAADGVTRAEVIGTPRTLALAGLADALTHDGDARVERLQAAALHAAAGPSPLVRAEVLLELGRALRHQRRPSDARTPLRQAIDLTRAAGATALAAEALSELEATGARRRREPAWGVESLTPREHELAQLAARGLTNTQIAERLFITRKTVETHMSAVLRKLEIGSRQELNVLLSGPEDRREATTLDR